MNSNELASEMREAIRMNRIPELAQRLREMSSTDQFQTLFPIAADSQSHGPAFLAALFLFVLKPPCTITCDEAIRALLPNWDISIEEVPWYLASQFGREVVARAIENLTKETLDREPTVRLGTVKYWSDIYFAMTPSQL